MRLTWQARATQVRDRGHVQPNCNCAFNLLNPGIRESPEAERSASLQPELHSDQRPGRTRRATGCLFEAGLWHADRQPGRQAASNGIPDDEQPASPTKA